jgi:hypothetical protein
MVKVPNFQELIAHHYKMLSVMSPTSSVAAMASSMMSVSDLESLKAGSGGKIKVPEGNDNLRQC